MSPHVFFKKQATNPDWDSAYAHPVVDEEFDTQVLTYQRGNILRIAVYAPGHDGAQRVYAKNIYDVLTDKEPEYYVGMPVQVLRWGAGGVRFADGSQPKDCLPPGTKLIGSKEWPNEMRWERVYKHYYDVTLYRTSTNIIRNCLMTEKTGRYEELLQALGENSLDISPNRFFAADLGDIRIFHGFKTRSATDFLSLVEVTEADLPPDFPKGLVRWEPRELPEEKKPDTP